MVILYQGHTNTLHYPLYILEKFLRLFFSWQSPEPCSMIAVGFLIVYQAGSL